MGERGGQGEKHQCVVASHVPPSQYLARNPGMCPDWDSTPWFAGQRSTHGATPARAVYLFYRSCFLVSFLQTLHQALGLNETTTPPPSQPSLPTFLIVFFAIALVIVSLFVYCLPAWPCLLEQKFHWYRDLSRSVHCCISSA